MTCRRPILLLTLLAVALSSAACGGSSSTAPTRTAAREGPTRLLASSRHEPAGSEYFEGAIYYLRVDGPTRGREYELSDEPLSIAVPSGPHRLVAFARPCNANCGTPRADGTYDPDQLDPPDLFCHVDADLSGHRRVLVIFHGAERCRIAVR